MAASLAQDALVFSLQATASDATKPNILPRGPLEIQAIRMIFSVIVTSATPAAAGRALQIFKGTNDAAGKTHPTGGTDLTAKPRPKWTSDQGVDSGISDARIATTAGLTAGAFTRDTAPLDTFDLAGTGAAATRLTFDFFRKFQGESLWLDPGEILVVSNPAAFDALLTWQLSVKVDYRQRDTR